MCKINTLSLGKFQGLKGLGGSLPGTKDKGQSNSSWYTHGQLGLGKGVSEPGMVWRGGTWWHEGQTPQPQLLYGPWPSDPHKPSCS